MGSIETKDSALEPNKTGEKEATDLKNENNEAGLAIETI